MAKLTITVKHSCGHDAEHRLTENTQRNARKADWLRVRARETMCFACQCAADTAAAAAAADAAQLPELVGSEKQVRWALTLREEFRALSERLIAERIEDHRARVGVVNTHTGGLRPRTPPPPPIEAAQVNHAERIALAELARRLAETSAAKWIDARGNNGASAVVSAYNDAFHAWRTMSAHERLLSQVAA